MLITKSDVWVSQALVNGPDDPEIVLKMIAFLAAGEFVRHHFKGKCVVGDASLAEILRVDPVTFAVDGVVQTLSWYQKVVTRKFSALLGIGKGPIRVGIDADTFDIARNGLLFANYFFTRERCVCNGRKTATSISWRALALEELTGDLCMSASNEWTEWHLTPRGWVRGTEKKDFKRVDREPSEDRVITIVYSEFVSSSFSAMDRNVETTWQSADAPAIAKLKAEFGPPPERL